MAERPIFVPAQDSPEFVKEVSFNIVWNSSFAPIQKKKNIVALHEAAAAGGYAPLLETSTKSEEKIGRHLSAFHLKVHSGHLGDIPLESAFQGSKVFERGGPYTDLYYVDVRRAKRDARLQNSGRLVAFVFDHFRFALEPKTAFYDWLYINAIFPHRDWLKRLYNYAGFTDIEFNPSKSINCQARSCALFVSLMKRELLDTQVLAPEAFVELVARHSRRAGADLNITSINTTPSLWSR
jgi:hypothetical protein